MDTLELYIYVNELFQNEENHFSLAFTTMHNFFFLRNNLILY